MRKYFSIIIASLIIAIAATGCSTKDSTKTTADSEDPKVAEMKKNLEEEFTSFFGPDKFSGYVYISKKGTVLLDKGYGKADYEKDIDNTKQTKFDLASLTKQFTAFSIMQLKEKMLLDINDKIDKYLPAFPHGNEISIHQLLTHTSGLPEAPDQFDIRKFRPSYKGFGIEGKDEKINLAFTPGTSFLYSNTGYILLGYIIEKVSGNTLDVYFSDNIFKPLDMKNTGFRNENGSLEGLSIGYLSANKDKANMSWYFQNVGAAIGSASLCSTVEDLLKWHKALSEQKLISKESYDKIYTPYKDSYGYGWYIYKDSNGKKSYEHYGNGIGSRSYIMRAVDEDIVVIILSNYANTPMGDIASMTKIYIK